jgi:hypothetical protein
MVRRSADAIAEPAASPVVPISTVGDGDPLDENRLCILANQGRLSRKAVSYKM